MSARRMTFYFDAASCSGCKACQIACMDRHGLAPDRPWRRVPEVAGGGWERDGAAWRNTVFAYHLSISCNHCERPICLEGCPTKAITRRDDGVVLIEPEHCLGCGYCSWTCPYSAPRLHAARGVMTKCSFCADDLDAGLEPACVAACPVRALDAGDPSDLADRHGSSDRAAGLAPLPPTDLTEPALHLTPHADGERSREPGVALTPRPPLGLREWSLVRGLPGETGKWLTGPPPRYRGASSSGEARDARAPALLPPGCDYLNGARGQRGSSDSRDVRRQP